LPLTKVVVAQNIFNFKLSKASRTAFTLLAQNIGHKHTKSKQANKEQGTIQIKALKERTKE
jgi:hypothetical protein